MQSFLILATMNSSLFQLLSSGIWPESESFSDQGFGPVPEKFKGECVPGEQFTLSNCNRYAKISQC